MKRAVSFAVLGTVLLAISLLGAQAFPTASSPQAESTLACGGAPKPPPKPDKPEDDGKV